MTHKEKMDWLKENDPITYYEMTDDPTGGSTDDFLGTFICFCLFIVLPICLITYFIF